MGLKTPYDDKGYYHSYVGSIKMVGGVLRLRVTITSW